jgi:hypothetical protein
LERDDISGECKASAPNLKNLTDLLEQQPLLNRAKDGAFALTGKKELKEKACKKKLARRRVVIEPINAEMSVELSKKFYRQPMDFLFI